MLNGHMYIEDNFNEIYHRMLKDVFLAPNHELTGISYCLTDPTNVSVENSIRKFNTDNADIFFKWVLAGDPDMTIMKKATKHAEMYDREVDGRNPHYGPRIHMQLEELYNELIENPSTRRATMLILERKDQIFLAPKREKRSTIEYPCCISLTYFIRNNYFHANTVMRSNNMARTICYDNYNFTHLQMYLLEQLNLKLVLLGKQKLTLGNYYHYIVNAHIVRGDVKHAGRILTEKYGELTKLTRLDT